MNKIGKVQYNGETARVEIFMSKHLAEWLEGQAKQARVSTSGLIKSWLLKIYNEHAQKASK